MSPFYGHVWCYFLKRHMFALRFEFWSIYYTRISWSNLQNCYFCSALFNLRFNMELASDVKHTILISLSSFVPLSFMEIALINPVNIFFYIFVDQLTHFVHGEFWRRGKSFPYWPHISLNLNLPKCRPFRGLKFLLIRIKFAWI